MPKLEKLGPMAIKHEQEYGSRIRETPSGYIFSMKVEDADVLDFSFLDYSKTRLKLILPEGAKDSFIRVPEGVEVHAEDNYNSYAKVRVIHPTSMKTYKARDLIHEPNHDLRNINGQHEIKNMSWDTKLYPAKQSQYLNVLYQDVLEHRGMAHQYWCRHLVAASVITKHARELEKKNPPPEGVRPVPWWIKRTSALTSLGLKELFPNKGIAEEKYYRLMGNAPNVFILKSVQILNAGISALLKITGADLKAGGPIEATKDFVVVISKDDADNSHALHLSLKVKLESDGSKLYKAKLYDPNISYTHKSIATYDLDVIRDELTTADFFGKMNSDYVNHYGYNHTRFYEIRPDFFDKPVTKDTQQVTYELLPHSRTYPLSFPATISADVITEEADGGLPITVK